MTGKSPLSGQACLGISVFWLVFTLAPGPSPMVGHAAPLPGDGSTGTAPLSDPSPSCPPCLEFDRLNTLIRDGGIPKDMARGAALDLLAGIRRGYEAAAGNAEILPEAVFPLQGYTAAAIAGGTNHGYAPRGYDYFDGNRHGGHPSLDIFIRDRNRDDRDDLTGEYVAVLSITGGIVVARESGWPPGSGLRGGKYLWIYDPAMERLIYYAHLRDTGVAIGTVVKPGDVLGHVGRTGKNASVRRSPTHLHVTCLSTASGAFRPVNIYRELVRLGR